MRSTLTFLGTFAFAALAGAAVLFVSQPDVSAAGPCGTTHDELDADEAALLSLFQDWRDDNLANSSTLTASGPLNAAAAWFAQYVSEGGVTNGHSDNFGRDYFDRAIDCGWPYFGGMGEGGVYTTSVAEAGSLLPGTSVATMQVPPTPNYPPVKCAGVGRAGSGNDMVWIVLLAQFPANQPCPQSLSTAPGPSPSATNTPTPSPTPTKIPQTNWTTWAPGLASNED
jgi:hypothetical protein